MPNTPAQARRRILVALPGLLREGLSSDEDVFADRLEAQQHAASTAAPADMIEARWLIDRIGRDGEFDANERALIAFLKKLAPQTDAALQPLIDQLAA